MTAIAIPAPVGGWNARDALAKMPPTDAVRLVNLVPRAGFVETRKGFSSWITSGLGGAVRTLASYRGAVSERLIAGAGGQLWNVTSTTPVSLASGFSANDWQTTAFDDRLIFTNGVNPGQQYNGTTMAALSVTGVSASTLWGCNTFKGRVFYWQRDASSFWYAAAGSFQGALTEFDMSAQLLTGGSLVMMVSWTLDSGDGVDDLAAFVFSSGEVLLYQGDDPGDAAAWSMVGRFQIGEPLGIRAHAKVGGTEIIVTRDGYVDLAQALRDGRYSEASAYSNKIIRAAKEATGLYFQQFGWEALLYPAGQMFIVNVPITTGQSKQHVRDTSGGGWCEFAGMNATTFAVHDNRLYFATSAGQIFLADTGTQDNGQPVAFDGIPAFNGFGSMASQKQLTAVNVVSNYAFPAYFALDGLSDFGITRRSTVTPGPFFGSSDWDTADWNVSSWTEGEGTDLQINKAWRNCRAFGYSVTVSVRGATAAQQIIWYATDYQFRSAGAI